MSVSSTTSTDQIPRESTATIEGKGKRGSNNGRNVDVIEFDSAREKTSELLKRAELMIGIVSKLKLEVTTVTEDIDHLYRNSADYLNLRGESKSHSKLMKDLGVVGLKTTVKDKEVVKAVAITDGLFAKFQNACTTYMSMVYGLNKLLNELPVAPATEQHFDSYQKLCEMRSRLQSDKNAIDNNLALARISGNWIFDRHCEGIGMQYYDRIDKVFKFVPILDENPPAQEVAKN